MQDHWKKINRLTGSKLIVGRCQSLVLGKFYVSRFTTEILRVDVRLFVPIVTDTPQYVLGKFTQGLIRYICVGNENVPD